MPVYNSSVRQKLYANYLATGKVESEGMTAETHGELNAKLFENMRKYSEELDNFTWYDGSKNLCQNTCAIADGEGSLFNMTAII